MTKEEIVAAAAKAGPLPEGLDVADTFLFVALRSLYLQAKHVGMDKAQGKKEKTAILRQHEKMKLWVRVVEEHRRKEQEFEGAWNAFAKDPTPENAEALHQAWYRCGLKINNKQEDK